MVEDQGYEDQEDQKQDQDENYNEDWMDGISLTPLTTGSPEGDNKIWISLPSLLKGKAGAMGEAERTF